MEEELDLVQLKNSLTLEELFVMYLLVRDSRIENFDNVEDAMHANNVYRRMKKYFNSTDYEDQIRAF